MDDPRRAMTESELEAYLQRQASGMMGTTPERQALGMVGMSVEQQSELTYQSHATLGDLMLDLLGERGER